MVTKPNFGKNSYRNNDTDVRSMSLLLLIFRERCGIPLLMKPR